LFKGYLANGRGAQPPPEGGSRRNDAELNQAVQSRPGISRRRLDRRRRGKTV